MNKVIYLDNAATTKPSQTAFVRAQEYVTDKYFNPSAMYKEGFAMQGELKKARSVLLSKIADETTFELVFTSCGTGFTRLTCAFTPNPAKSIKPNVKIFLFMFYVF